MTRDEAVRTLKSMKSDFPLPKAAQTRRAQNEALDVAIEALKVEPCEDAVSRQAAIEAIRKLPNAGMHWFVSAEAVFDALLKLPSAQTEQRWIPVTERLPEEGHDVLITKEPLKIKGYEQEVIKAKRSVDPRSGKIEWWSEFGALTNKAVLAWMPLPEKYAELEGMNRRASDDR